VFSKENLAKLREEVAKSDEEDSERLMNLPPDKLPRVPPGLTFDDLPTTKPKKSSGKDDWTVLSHKGDIKSSDQSPDAMETLSPMLILLNNKVHGGRLREALGLVANLGDFHCTHDESARDNYTLLSSGYKKNRETASNHFKSTGFLKAYLYFIDEIIDNLQLQQKDK